MRCQGYLEYGLRRIAGTCVLLLTIFVAQSSSNFKPGPGSMVDDQSRLLDVLLSNYDRRIPPQYNSSQPVRLSVGIHLLNLIDLHEHEQALETFVYLEQIWHDYRLTWEPSAYHRIHTVRVPLQSLWTPDISLFNNIDVNIETMNALALILSDGTVYYSPTVRFRTRCALDMTRFPFDKQACAVILGSYMYDSMALNFSLGPSKLRVADDFETNREWMITDMTSEIVTKYYDCCEEGYQTVRFTFEFTRRSVYYTYVFVLPAVILAILVPFQFLLPPDCKERLTVGSTLLLGCIVIIAMIQSFLPDAHPNLPYIVQYYCLTLIWIAVSIVGSMWVINTQNRGPRKRRVPILIRQLFLKTLKKLVCLNDDTYYPLEEAETISLRSLEKQLLANGDPLKHEINKLERDVEEILRHMNVLVHVVSESRGNVQTEWYQVALVFDRIMCFLFSLVFIIYTCVLLG